MFFNQRLTKNDDILEALSTLNLNDLPIIMDILKDMAIKLRPLFALYFIQTSLFPSTYLYNSVLDFEGIWNMES